MRGALPALCSCMSELIHTPEMRLQGVLSRVSAVCRDKVLRGRCCLCWMERAGHRTCNVCSALSSAEMRVPCVLQEMMHDEEDAASAGGKPRPQDRVRQWLGLGGRRKAESAQGAVDPSNPESVKVGCKAHPGQWVVLGWHAKSSAFLSKENKSNPESVKVGCKAHPQQGLMGCAGAGTPTQLSIPRQRVRMQAPGIRPCQLR